MNFVFCLGAVDFFTGICYSVLDGKEIQSRDFEVLVNTQPQICFVHWASPHVDGSMPKRAAKAGVNAKDSAPLYIAKARLSDWDQPKIGKIRDGDLTAVVAYNGESYTIPSGEFKVLCVEYSNDK